MCYFNEIFFEKSGHWERRDSIGCLFSFGFVCESNAIDLADIRLLLIELIIEFKIHPGRDAASKGDAHADEVDGEADFVFDERT
jgi:hypothetical protein